MVDVDYAAAWNTLTNGNWLGAMIQVNTIPMGYFFFAFIFGIAYALIYFKTQNMAIVGITALLTAGFVLTFLPVEVHRLAYFLIVFGGFGIIYKAFKG